IILVKTLASVSLYFAEFKEEKPLATLLDDYFLPNKLILMFIWVSNGSADYAATAEKQACSDILKGLPEAVGELESLKTLPVRYNNISRLPTTMSSLTNIKELDLCFNELESVPKSLCFDTTLVKINISNNFVDLRSPPRSIGNLENLEELDMSNNKIRVLPYSFKVLSKLHVLNTEGNPLEIPPRDVLDIGARAVVLYMNELHQKKNEKVQPVKKKKSWTQIFFSMSNKRKRITMTK
ncbi:hypothetical protein M8C21_004115, partial [Ambrosia artemisiifolia]